MRIFLFALIFFISSQSMAFGSVCDNYDVFSTHPDDIRVELVIKCMHLDDSFYLDGPIDENLIFEISTRSQNTIKKIFLNSGGGRVEDAIEVAEFIRENDIETFLRPGAKCYSACTILFQAGINRVAHPSSEFMYHSARYPHQHSDIIQYVKDCFNKPTKECMGYVKNKTAKLQKITDEIFELYVLYGASPDLYTEYKGFDLIPDWFEDGNYLKIKNWYMGAEEAFKYQIPTEVSEEKFKNFKYSLDRVIAI